MVKMYSYALKSVILPIADIAMQTSVASCYKKIRKMQAYKPEDIVGWQSSQLKKLIEHAYNHTKYYKELFDSKGLCPKDIGSQDDLNKLPVLTKRDIRQKFSNLTAGKISSIPHHKSSTGGSSGDPCVYLLDHNSWSFSHANNILNWERLGYKYGEKYVALGSTSLFVDKIQSFRHRIYYRLKNKIGLNGMNMSDDVCREYVDLIRTKSVHFIYGYASSIYLLARYVVKRDLKLNIQACFTTSEILTDIYRKTIGEAFQCKILDCYGANDGGVMAFSYQPGFFEVGYNCIVRLHNPDCNGLGSALLTDLLNYAMPLINYQLGDKLEIDIAKSITYPYNGQIINNVLGRASDLIYLENGRLLTGPGFTILFKDLPVEYYCIEKIGINSIKCSIKKLAGYNDGHEDLIIRTFRRHAGFDINLSIEYNDEIKLSESGKRQYFVSDKESGIR